MDKAPNSYINIDHQDLYSSTIPWDNAFDFAEEIDLAKIYNFGADVDPSKIIDFGEEEDLSKIFDMPQAQHMNATIIPSTSVENPSPNHHQISENVSELSNVIPMEQQPMTTTNILSYSSYIYSMEVNNVSILQVEGGTSKNSFSDGINQENPKTFIPIPIVMEKQDNTMSISRRRDQENPKINDMILEQPLPKIPILEKLERESSLKSNGMILQQPMKHILTLEKIESHLMKSKQENISGGYGILSCLDNEFPHKTSTNKGPIRRSPNRTSSRYQPFVREGKSYSTHVAQDINNKEALVGRNSNHHFQHSPTYTHEITNKFKEVAIGKSFNEYTQGYGYSNQAITLRSLNSKKENEDGATSQFQPSWNTHDNHFNTRTNRPQNPFQ